MDDLSSTSFLSLLVVNFHSPEEELRSIRWAPSLAGAAAFALPLPSAKGLALVVGGGAAMAAHGSPSSTAGAVVVAGALAPLVRGFVFVRGAGTAMEAHGSSSTDFAAGLGGGAATAPHGSSSSSDVDEGGAALGFGRAELGAGRTSATGDYFIFFRLFGEVKVSA